MDGAMVSVAVVASRTEAELIVGMLGSHGVSAAVSADDAAGQYPQMQIEGVRVLVAPADEASARRLLAADQCTGEFNLQTRDALRAFQKREGLPATGLPSYETVEHLGLDLEKIFRSTRHAEAPPRRADSPR